MTAAEPSTADDGSADLDADPDELAAQVELLATENQRLRRAHAHSRRTRHRRTAIGLAALGILALAGAALFPDVRTVLVALGAIGVFGGLLTYYVTPERFVTASVGESVYRATADNGSALVDDLGLTDDRVYVPLPSGVAGARDVTLYVPQRVDHDLPEPDALDAMFVVTDDERERGASLHPTGEPLFQEFERTLAGGLSDEPGPLVEQLADGLVESFELADGAAPEVAPDDGRVAVGVRGSAMGSVDRFDHPIASFLACGLAVGLEVPVRLEAVTTGDDRVDYVVTCAWDVEE